MPIWWDARGLVRDTRQGVRHVCIATMPKKTENLPLLASGGVAACDGRFLSRAFFAADCAGLRWHGIPLNAKKTRRSDILEFPAQIMVGVSLNF